jgi:hypothetical protein
MSKTDANLPHRGRGTMRSMVEGQVRLFRSSNVRNGRACPSTPPLRVAVPLPFQGRIA